MIRTLRFCSLATIVIAQSQPPTFRAQIELVQVDVVVVDQAGNPVRGIRQSDLTLFDRRKPQAVATFDEVSHDIAADAASPALPPSVKRDVASNQTGGSGRLIVMVIDDFHIWKSRTDRARSS